MSINLEKGQKISLSKQGDSLSRVAMGLGWDGIETKGFFGFGGGKKAVDLDASCIIVEGNKVSDTVWFRNLRSLDGYVMHSGDNRSGDGDGDDETISVNLSKLSERITALVFVINSFTGETFNQISNAYCRLINMDTGEEIAKFKLTEKGEHTSMIMAKLYRHDGEWKMGAIGEVGRGRTVADLVPQVLALL
jgi:tellurium resistance protein TerZ